MQQKISLTQTQSQKQVLSAQQLQSLHVLQLSSTDLEEFLDQQALENPFVICEKLDIASPDTTLEPRSQPSLELPSVSIRHTSSATASSELTSDPASYGREGPLSLVEHAILQARMAFADEQDFSLAVELISRLDESGYITEPLTEIAQDVGRLLEDIHHVLQTLQTFEPTGVFATSLAECLSLQLSERDRLDPAMSCLLKHLDLVARMDWQTLGRLCGVDREDILEMCAELRQLDPRPGQSISVPAALPIRPDIRIAREDAVWCARLIRESQPRFSCDHGLFKRLGQQGLASRDQHFVRDCWQDAQSLHRAVHQRQSTLQDLADILVREQGRFFDEGPSGLRPLNQRSCARELGLHESTISRAVRNKFVETPHGTLPLQYFFSNALPAARDTDASARSIQARIRQMINEETPDDILSDDRLSNMLGQQGCKTARRTVTKYRESMGIPKSSQRRKIKDLENAVKMNRM